MDNELYLLGLKLRAIAHVLHFSDYIQEITKDSDFETSLISVTSEYLYAVSERTLEKISNNYKDTGFDRKAVFGVSFNN